MKKKLIKINEEGGIGSSSTSKKPTITISKDKLRDTLSQTKDFDVNVNVIDESSSENILEYVSNVYTEDGEISKPFNIGKNNFQYVRAKKNGKIVEAVYSIDEEKIYGFDEYKSKFIDNIDKKNDLKNIFDGFNGFKHFIIDSSNGEPVKTFKSAREMINYFMSPEYKYNPSYAYMNIKDFKRFKFKEAYGDKISEIKSLAEELGISTKLYENNESLVVTKNQLREIVNGYKIIKTVKIKDIK